MSTPCLSFARAAAFATCVALAAGASAAPKNPPPSARRAVRVVAPPPPPADHVAEAEHEDEGLFGPIRIGPLAGVSIPRPVSVEVFAKYKRAVGLGLEYSAMPTLTIDGVSVHTSAVAGDLRWFVLDSPFFLGAGVGVQSLTGSGSVSGFSGTAQGSKVFVTPRLGVLWTFGPGFSLGADVGVEIPVAHQETIVPALDVVTNNAFLVALTRSPLPDVHLARLGWLF